ncbi:hypothetical protein F5148DRAFT_1191471 [Russula earlei]|uniref:Uncharacterized protein n=1 Tax=Russula earlei TaxID=71964 RepID=A0ACC0UBR8_9AGAM|nr:hypothetical protein F5148DRAFT_1191471 [Russula earlei]
MYQARVLELKQLILAEEARFNSGRKDAEDFGVDESAFDRTALSPKSERVSAIEGSGSDLTGVSDTSSSAPQVQADQPFPEEDMVQRQLDEDLTIPDALPNATTPPSSLGGDVEQSVAQELSPMPSPVVIDYVDEHARSSPRPRHESPDPLDLITPAEDDGELESLPTHKRAEAVRPSSSPACPLEGSDRAVSVESKHSNIPEPTKIVEVHQVRETLERLMTSELVECPEAKDKIGSDKPTVVSTSNPVEGEMSTEDGSQMLQKDDVSVHSLFEPTIVVQAVQSRLPLEGATTSVACTPETGPYVTRLEGEYTTKRKFPEDTQLKQDDEMETEQEDGHEAASPDAEPSRRDHKRKVSEAASIFSDAARDSKRTREDSQPVDDDESSPVIIMVHSQISQHRNGNIFHNPIKTSEAPDYYDIVKRPMDLKTIKSRIREGQIASSDEFQRDVYLMFANSLMYNRPGSDIYTMAEEMMLESEAQINSFRQTEGIIKGSHR